MSALAEIHFATTDYYPAMDGPVQTVSDLRDVWHYPIVAVDWKRMPTLRERAVMNWLKIEREDEE